ncbi:MAG TPA: type II toxin-antitoxin system RatA family toxin [Rhizobacter sp.]|jgi:ribosome-associated toxin RatA of RatAB toxin-antitoxin module|nr:type II toxin-antitoxin system RatA family toxin [Rhizobacter sp.]
MKHVKKSVLLSYSAAEMYALVTAVTDYPKFLPWCENAEVISEDESGMTARLHLGYGGLRHAFTTRNTHVRDSSVLVSLVDGPFSVLDGSWRFLPLALAGDTPACKIEFEMRYAFASTPLEVVVSPVFDRVANTFVDAFVKRAEQVYGSR